MAHHWAARWPGQTVAFEVRRDLLVPQWVWHDEMCPDPDKVARVAEALVQAWA